MEVTLKEVSLSTLPLLKDRLVERQRKTALKNLIDIAEHVGDGNLKKALKENGLPKSITVSPVWYEIIRQMVVVNYPGVTINCSSVFNQNVMLLDWVNHKTYVDTITT